MNIKDKIDYLKQIRKHMDDDTFKYIAADIYTKYYVSIIQGTDLSKNMKYVLRKVNRALKSLDVDEVSYYYIRKRISRIDDEDKQLVRRYRL